MITFYSSLEPRITVSVKELGDLLLSVKNAHVNMSQANSVAVEADEVLRPLMDLLDGSLTLYAQSCEKTVLKRLLKELWKIVIRILEKTIVLPPMTDRTVSFLYILFCLEPLNFFMKSPDDAEKYDGHCEEFSGECENRGHGHVFQESNGKEVRCENSVKWGYGYIKGGGEEPVPKTMRSSGGGPRYDKAVFPRWRKWIEEDVLRQIT